MCGVRTADGEVSGAGPEMAFVLLLAPDVDGYGLKEHEECLSVCVDV